MGIKVQAGRLRRRGRREESTVVILEGEGEADAVGRRLRAARLPTRGATLRDRVPGVEQADRLRGAQAVGGQRMDGQARRGADGGRRLVAAGALALIQDLGVDAVPQVLVDAAPKVQRGR
eukprot:scaffold7640_cov239-Pinguiococcus_pyrenoidosus.AAC.3